MVALAKMLCYIAAQLAACSYLVGQFGITTQEGLYAKENLTDCGTWPSDGGDSLLRWCSPTHGGPRAYRGPDSSGGYRSANGGGTGRTH